MPKKRNTIVVDVLMESACQNNEIEKAFIWYVYHRNVSIIYVPCAKCITTAITGEAATNTLYNDA